MTKSLAGKVIFITGGSRGIGREIALRAAKDGAKLIIAAKTTEAHSTLEGTIYTVAEVEAEPTVCNSNLGYYTNFMNLLDLSAVAIPTGFQANGLPFGATIAAPANCDNMLLALAEKMHYALGVTGGVLTKNGDM